jgi:hypothetical protein
MNRTKKQHRTGMKIPTILGARLTHSDNWRPTLSKKAHAPGANLKNKEHKMKIIGEEMLQR